LSGFIFIKGDIGEISIGVSGEEKFGEGGEGGDGSTSRITLRLGVVLIH
jgi:hypothetical protein